MFETIFKWFLLIYAMFENEPVWGIVAAILAVASQIYWTRREG